MIIGYSAHGKGGATGDGAIQYLTSEEVHARDEHGKVIKDDEGRPVMYRRDPPPEVLRGDPQQTLALINSLAEQGRQRTYSGGVLSFAPGEWPSEEQQQRIMDAFERHTFAGLEPGQYDCLWVRHTDKGRLELNFLIPRVELTTGKALNPDPPGAKNLALKDALRDYINEAHGWIGPMDRSRERAVKVPDWQLKLEAAAARGIAAAVEQGALPADSLERAEREEDPREFITRQMVAGIEAGTIRSRADVLDTLKAAGFEINRRGRDYVSVRDPETNDKYRLKGAIYAEAFTDREALAARPDYAETVAHARAATAAREQRAGANRKPDPERVREARQRLEKLSRARAEYNRQRYPAAGPSLSAEAKQALEAERAGLGADAAPSLDRFLSRSLGPDAIPGAPSAGPAGRDPRLERDRSAAPGPQWGAGDRAGGQDIPGAAGRDRAAVELQQRQEPMHHPAGEVAHDTDGEAITGRFGALGKRVLAALEGIRQAGGRAIEYVRQLTGAADRHDDALSGLEQASERLGRAVAERGREGAILDRAAEQFNQAVEQVARQIERESQRQNRRGPELSPW